MNELLDDYISAHLSPEPPLLAEVYRRTYLDHLYPRMCSGHLQGRILAMLTRLIAPMRILELGAFTGYSALSIAGAMPAGAQLHSVEIDDEMEPELLERFEACGRGADIHLHIGDALEMIGRLGGEWDLAYIDANKRQYPEYFEALAGRIAPGGYIIADNTLWDGKVANPAQHDPQTEGIRRFNDMAAADPRFETVILPLRDGLTVMRRI